MRCCRSFPMRSHITLAQSLYFPNCAEFPATYLSIFLSLNVGCGGYFTISSQANLVEMKCWEKASGDTDTPCAPSTLFSIVCTEHGQVSIFYVVSPFCKTQGEQRHLFFHVDTTRGSTGSTASLLIHTDMKAHT